MPSSKIGWEKNVINLSTLDFKMAVSLIRYLYYNYHFIVYLNPKLVFYCTCKILSSSDYIFVNDNYV